MIVIFCEKCGNRLEDGSLFCDNCGAKVGGGNSGGNDTSLHHGNGGYQTGTQGQNYGDHQNGNMQGYGQNYGGMPGQGAPGPNMGAPNYNNMQYNIPQGGYGRPAGPAPNRPKGAPTGIIVLVVLILLVCAGGGAAYYIISNQKVTVDLNEFVKVEFTGYESAGKAEMSFDEAAFDTKFGSKVKFIEKNSSYDSPSKFLSDKLEPCFEDAEGLKNGDSVSVDWSRADVDLIEKTLNCKIKYSDAAFTAEGLEEVKEADPFEKIDVVFSGEEERGKVDIYNDNSKPLDEIKFEPNKYYGLKNGDKVIVSISGNLADVEQKLLEENGIKLSQTKKTYTVEGLDTTVTTTETTTEATTQAPTQAQAPGTGTALSSGYVLPGSDSRYITRAELDGLTKEQCRLARNEIYARHGRKFKDAQLQAYFNSCSWYVPTVEPGNFSESVFNAYEKANKDLIVAYEKEKGYQ